MSSQYYTIKANAEFEIIIKKSRFICFLKRIETEDEAKELIKEIKKTHFKANHNCFAYVLGEKQAIQRSSDDGEPSGTAGIPMLEVLKTNHLSNVLAVVTRYFGGTKLGTGGLIRAYSQSVSNALEHVGIVKGVLQQEINVTVTYSQHGKMTHFLENQVAFTLKDTVFTDKVILTIMVNQKDERIFKEKITNLLNDKCAFQLGEKSYTEFPI